MTWQRYAARRPASSTALGILFLYALQRLQGWLPLNGAGLAARESRGRAQHRRELRHQHELAGLRRRDHDEPPDADAGPHGPELRVGGDRHGGARRADPRLHAPAGRRRRQLLGGPGRARRSTCCCRSRSSSRCCSPGRACRRPSRRRRRFRCSSRRPTADGNPVTTQEIALGPVASQIAIKQLGTNGGGYYNVNSAHPLENPTPLSNFLEMLSILLIAAALCFTFGELVQRPAPGLGGLRGDVRDLHPAAAGVLRRRAAAATRRSRRSAPTRRSALQAGGNMEGKEVRFGIANSRSGPPPPPPPRTAR